MRAEICCESACADSWGHALKTREVSLSIPCYAERRYGGVADDEIGQMRTIERASGGSIARAIVTQQSAVAVFDFARRADWQQRFHPAIKRDFGLRKFRRSIARS